MSAPLYLYTPEITHLIQDYIYDGFKSYEDLSDYEKSNLTVAAMNALGEDAHEAIVEHEDLRLVIHHMKMFIKTAKKEYATDLAETMAKNAVEYFDRSLSELYSEICEQACEFGEAA